MGIVRIPGYQEIKKMAYNFMKCEKLVEKKREHFGDRNIYWNVDLNLKLYKLISKYIQLDPLRKEYLDPYDGCGVLYFANAVRDLDELLHGFNYKECIKRKSILTSNDYETLIELIQEYEQEKNLYQKYDKLSIQESSKKVGDDILHDLQTDPKIIKNWEKQMKFRMTKNGIINFVSAYWRGEDSDNYSSSDDDELFDIMMNGDQKLDDNKNNDDDDDELKSNVKPYYRRSHSKSANDEKLLTIHIFIYNTYK